MSVDAHGNFRGKRLVVFGCGYVGSAVAEEARARGVSVVALTRNEAKAAALREREIDVVVADLASDAWHGRIGGRADFVLNCVSSGGGGLEGYRRSYVDGMRSILAWASASDGAGSLVYTSSTAVYPQGNGAVVDESAPTGGSDRAEILLEAEAMLRGAEKACARWFVLRLAGIYGPGRFHLVEQVRRGEVAGRGEHRLNLAHRDDIVAAVWACFGAPPDVRNEIFNVADGAATPKAEVAAWLAARLGAPTPRFTGAPTGGRERLVPDRIIASAKLRAALGWRPRYPSFRAGAENLLSR
ncbi:MAG TPA: NAD-dependent epimerase/dehydratase family protein [Opitutaceae bacterium]|nr:NAD-dependent epimerase/dehydratase family protein [Opitutaceae bacterium]